MKLQITLHGCPVFISTEGKEVKTKKAEMSVVTANWLD
jgi:hypothetical protein